MGLTRTILGSTLVDTLTTPHGIDRYLELVNPMWSVHEVRARIERIDREAPDVVTLTLRPTGNWRGARAGQHVQVGVVVDGVRRTRCFSLSSSAHRPDGRIALTVKAHDKGYVSRFLNDHASVGTVLQLSEAEGGFALPSPRPRRMLMLSAGSGITPLMSMLRTLCDEGYDGSVTFLHYARTAEDTIFDDELTAIAAAYDFVDIIRVRTREESSPLDGRFCQDHLEKVAPDFAGISTFACGPNGFIQLVQDTYGAADAADQLHVEYFKTPVIQADTDAEGVVSFERSNVAASNSGQTLLDQAESAGLRPEFGCRMGICFTCTTRKTEGTVRNVITGNESALPDENIQICVNAPVSDCTLDL